MNAAKKEFLVAQERMFHTFVWTTAEGTRRYGHTICFPKNTQIIAFCIISPHDKPDTFCTFLNSLPDDIDKFKEDVEAIIQQAFVPISHRNVVFSHGKLAITSSAASPTKYGAFFRPPDRDVRTNRAEETKLTKRWI